MAEMLLINPRRRRKTAKRATAKRRVIRRKNPVSVSKTRSIGLRRRNPIGLGRVHRRRRNPIGGLRKTAIMGEIKSALLGGAGAVAIDVLMGQLNAYIPASLRRTPGKLGVGDLVKLGITVLAGQILSKPTRGLSKKMALGALTVQARDVMASLVPASMSLGYASPARIVRGQQRVGPLMQNMGAYIPNRKGTAVFGGNGSPVLAAYNSPGRNRSLNLNGGALNREGVSNYR